MTSTFPAETFQLFGEKQLHDFLEISHYTSRVRIPDDVNVVLEKIQKLLPFEQIIGGLAQLNSEGRFDQYVRVYNVSYPNDWLYVHAKNGYAEVGPVFLSLTRQSGGQVCANTYEGVKQRTSRYLCNGTRAFVCAEPLARIIQCAVQRRWVSCRCKSCLGSCRDTPVAPKTVRRVTDWPKLLGQRPTSGGSAS